MRMLPLKRSLKMRKPEQKKRIAQAAALLCAALFLVLGISRGEMAVVLNKAVNICMECIGLG